MKLPPGARRLLSIVLMAAAFAYIGAEIVRNIDQLRGFDWRVRPALLVSSVLLLVLLLFLGVVIWAAVLRRFGVEAPLLPLARAWFISNVSKYIPGVVWQFLSLADLGVGAGLAPAVAIASLLVQMGFMLIGAAVIGVYFLPEAAAGALAPVQEAGRWLAPLALVAVHPRVIRFLLAHTGRITRTSGLEWRGGWIDSLWLLVLAGLAWAGTGAAFFLFLRSFVEVPLALLPALTAMNALAFIAGYVAFFAPGGLGFREAALTLLLGSLMPPAVAASLSVATRLWAITAEVLPALALLASRPRRVAPLAGPEA